MFNPMLDNLTLVDAEIDAIARIQTRLLNGRLDDRTVILHLLDAIGDLIGSARSFATHVLGDDFQFASRGIGPQIERYFKDSFQGFDAIGNFRLSDPELEEINRRRREMGPAVYHEGKLQQSHLIRQTRYYRTAFEPAGMHHVIGMSTPLPSGEAVLAFGFDGEDDPGFSGSRSIAILRVLHPAFCTGFERAFTLAKAEKYARHVLATYPGAELHGPARPAADGDSTVIPGPALADRDASWFLIPRQQHDLSANLADAATQFGLTKRQNVVLLLMIQGSTAPQIARELDISVNTARRHCEAVLKRTGAKTRGALYARVLDGSGVQGRT